MLERVEVEKKSRMPGWQNCRWNLSVTLDRSAWNHASVFRNSRYKEVKLLTVESKELKVHWFLL